MSACVKKRKFKKHKIQFLIEDTWRAFFTTKQNLKSQITEVTSSKILHALEYSNFRIIRITFVDHFYFDIHSLENDVNVVQLS